MVAAASDAEADGAALLRSDHTETFDAKGKPTGAFHQIMLIYPEGGTLHADYSDGEGHVIHYTTATVSAGRSVIFTSPPTPGAPTFLLTYEARPPNALSVNFSMFPPDGRGDRHHPITIASGTLKKAR